MTLDFKSTLNVIRKIENAFEVNSLEYNGIGIWPLIRLAMYMRMHLGDGKINKNGARDKSVKDLGSRGFSYNALSKLIRKTNSLTDKIIDLYNIKKYEGLKKSLRKEGQVDCLFFSRTVDHTDKIKDMSFDRYIDPMIDFVRRKHSCLKMEIDAFPKVKKIPRYEQDYLINEHEVVGGHIIHSRKVQRRWPISGMNEILKAYSDITHNKLDKDWILGQAYSIELFTLIFRELLSIINPRVVFLVCYYYQLALALINACKQLDIKTVDIQHGQQSKYHPMYGYWTRIPVNGYELLPDYFWIWGDSNQRNILDSRPVTSVFHNPIVGGNRWIPFWKKKKHNFIGRTVEQAQFMQRLGNYKRIILYALSGEPDIKDLVVEHVMDAIADSPKEWLWLVRLHPQHLNKIEELTCILQGKGLRNSDVEYASRSTLYELFEYISVVVTEESTTSIEALYFKIPVIITSQQGSDLYQEYIQNGLFTYAPTRQELYDSLQKDSNKKLFQKIDFFVETSDEIADSALSIIMSS